MLDSLITSKTRMRLLLKFFSNTQTKSYLRSLADEFGESTNSVRVELNRLSKAGLLLHEHNGNTIVYKANENNPFFKSLQKIVIKYMGVDDILENVIRKLGELELAFITGDYARGIDSGVIDLVIVARKMDKYFLNHLHERAERISQRKIRLLALTLDEFGKIRKNLDPENSLILFARPESGFKNSLD